MNGIKLVKKQTTTWAESEYSKYSLRTKNYMLHDLTLAGLAKLSTNWLKDQLYFTEK